MQDGEIVRKKFQRWNTPWQAHGLTFSCYRRQPFLSKERRYIHYNPVVRGLVARPEDWPWSSARDWCGMGPRPIRIDRQTCIDSML